MKANEKAKQTPKREMNHAPETIEERVHRHISDINSKITDEDIKSVKTELDVRRNSPNQPKEKNTAVKKQKRKPGRNDRDEKNSDENAPERHTTPRDLLSEGYE